MALYDKDYFKDLEKAQKSEVPRNLRILRLIEKYSSPKKILDVGVGTGLFLYLAQQSGWQIYGADVSKYAINKLSKELKGEFYCGSLEKASLKKNSFDAINMRHALEHIKNPLKTLKCTYKLLKPGGVISVAVPNSFGLHAKFYSKDWPHWDKTHHVNFFSMQSLQELMRSAGFEIVLTKTEELTIFDLLKYLICKAGLKINYKRPMRVSLILDKLLALLGLGEGLVVVCKKPK